MKTIRTHNLTRTFDETVAVDHLTLEVDEGEVFGLVGPDGAGKTTTMRLLTGIMTPSSGDAWVVDRHVVRESEAVKEEIGYMSQRFGLYSDLTVQENIDFYADIYSVPRKGRKEKVDELLAFSNLAPFRKRLAGNLSGGMKQKLGLVCSLIHTPKVLFLDEPTNGVDPVSRRDFWKILYQLLRQKVTIFVSTAYLDEAERCNRLGLIHQGRLLACGAPEEIKGLMKGTILELRPINPRETMNVLRNKFGRRAVSLFGDRVHVVADDPQQMKKSMTDVLHDAKIEPGEIRWIEPTLEDVFVSVLADKNQGAIQDGT
ncbi:MAG: ABC transporter ATP-binding protein [Phycisphaerae bacterium]|mgnify:CR=1 FL=1|nr:ABC transporter ATP-binding protein [Phycisphaerae bacterium]